MHHREYPISPSQQAIIGALSIYVEGGKKDNVRQMLFGLSVLRHGTEAQLRIAVSAVAATQQATEPQIHAMLAQ
jgi:hypothetical protein